MYKRQLLRRGLEGVSYTVTDGVPEQIKDDKGNQVYYAALMPQFASDISRFGFFPGNSYNLVLYRAMLASLDQLPGFDAPDKLVSYNFVGTDSEAIKADTETYFNEQLAKVLAGEIPLDDWDDIMSRWLEIGGDQLTKDRNAQYQASLTAL